MTGYELLALSPYDYSNKSSNKTSVVRCSKKIYINDAHIFATVGDILYIEYICYNSDNIYVRNTKTKEVASLSPGYFLSYLEMSNTEESTDNRIIHLKFTLKDSVWFIYETKAVKGTVISFNTHYNRYSEKLNIIYHVEFLYEGRITETEFNEDKCFATKEELLKSL